MIPKNITIHKGWWCEAANTSTQLQLIDDTSSILSIDKLIVKLFKQGTSLRECVHLYKLSEDSLHEMVDTFQRCLTRVESTVGENFEKNSLKQTNHL